jgi:hypothetical protein
VSYVDPDGYIMEEPPDFLDLLLAHERTRRERGEGMYARISWSAVTALPAFTCPDCGMTSRNPNDVREGYCGSCHDWTGPQRLSSPWNVGVPC